MGYCKGINKGWENDKRSLILKGIHGLCDIYPSKIQERLKKTGERGGSSRRERKKKGSLDSLGEREALGVLGGEEVSRKEFCGGWL